MRGIAVEKHDISGLACFGNPIQRDRASSLCDEHQKKAVITVPLQKISGFINEMAGADRIEEIFSGESAGGINILIRVCGYVLFMGIHESSSFCMES